MFQKMQTINETQRKIATEQLVFVYIGQKNCSVCHSLKPQVETILREYSDIVLLELDALETPMVAEAFQVLTVPVLLFFIDGKEYLRKARIVNTQELKAAIDKIVLGVRSMTEMREGC